MYKIIDDATEIEGLGKVIDFLVELNGALFDKFQGFDDNDLELEYSEKYDCHRVSYFNVDDREYRSDEAVVEFIRKEFDFLREVEWDRNDAYPDGTASYILYFKLESK